MADPNYTFDNSIPKVGGGNGWSLALANNMVVVGGSYSSLGGVPRVNLSGFNIITKAVMPFAPVVAGAPIVDIMVFNGVIYVAALGSIVTAAGPVRNGVAAFDLAGNLLPWNPDANAPVRSLGNDGTNIILGGDFTTLGGGLYPRTSLAIVDAVNGVPTAFAPVYAGGVNELLYDPTSSSIYTVGAFTTVNATARNFAAQVDMAGALLPWDPNFNSPANSLVLNNNLVTVGGFFSTANGGTPRNGVAVLDPVTGVLDPETYGFTTSSSVFKVSINPVTGNLYVGGGLGVVQGTDPNGMTVLDPTTGLLVPPETSFGSPVLDFLFSATYVIVVGFFSQFLGDFSSPDALSFDYGSVDRSAYHDPGRVQNSQGIVFDGSRIIVPNSPGNTVYAANGTFVSNGLTFYDLAGNFLPVNPVFAGGGPLIYKVVVDGGLIYAAGRFTTVDGNPRVSFVVLDSSGVVQPLDLQLDLNPFLFPPTVYDMLVDATHIYLVGNFLNVNGGTSAPNIARFDKTTGIYDATWTPTVLPVFNAGQGIYQIASDGTYIYIGGDFTSVQGQPRLNLARIPIAGTGAPDPGWVFDVDAIVQSMFLNPSSNDLYLAGIFTTINAVSTPNIARIYSTGVLDPTLSANLNLPANTVRVFVNGPDLFISMGGPLSNPVFGEIVGSVFSVNLTGTALTWFKPRLQGFASGFLVADGRLFVVGGWGYLYVEDATGGLAAFYSPALPPVGIPRAPVIEFLNRKKAPADGPQLTLLKWKPVSMDVNNNYTTVQGYRVYRTSSLNLEDPVLIAEITSLDIRGFVDTMFTEEIDGFFKYCVSAFNSAGEGGKSCIASVAQAQSDRI